MIADGPEGTPRRVTIFPSEFYSTRGQEVISTLLGSCVAACLYDPQRNLIGMNHFLLSSPRYSRDLPFKVSEAGRFGIHAMELLINDMMAKGTNRACLRAKVFGGATLLGSQGEEGNFSCIGEVNCRFIRDYLKAEDIPIDAEDLGGTLGRVIHFSNGNFHVYRRLISSTDSRRQARIDLDCWQRALEEQRRAMTAIDLW